MRFRHPFALAVLFAAFSLAVGCGGSSTTSRPLIVVAIAPKTITIPVDGTRQFDATVTGSNNTAVTWSVTEQQALPWLSVRGPATAAFTPQALGEFHIVATSVADTHASDTATVTVSEVSALQTVEDDLGAGEQ